MKKLILSIAALVALTSGEVFAQLDPQFTHYTFNYLFFNPAYAGAENVARIQGIHRTQWLGNSGNESSGMSPQSQLISFNAPILRTGSGVGFYILNDRIGARNMVDAQLSLAHHFNVGGGKLGFGVRAGVSTLAMDWTKYRWRDVRDPYYRQSREQQSSPDVSFGMWYRKEKYYIGLSGNHLLESNFDFGIPNVQNKMTRTYYATAGYNLQLNNEWMLTPSFLLKNQGEGFDFPSLEVSAIAYYTNKFFVGANYRQSESVSALFGLSFLENNALRFSYAIDLTAPASEAKRPTSHEVMLSYAIPVQLRLPKPIIRTPRYRK